MHPDAVHMPRLNDRSCLEAPQPRSRFFARGILPDYFEKALF
jgi:hypothetical protein